MFNPALKGNRRRTPCCSIVRTVALVNGKHGVTRPLGTRTSTGNRDMANTFGKMFNITTWGESHGDAVGVSSTAARR